MIPPPIFPSFPNLIKPQQEQDQDQDQGDDYFDLLPDPIVVVILNRLNDAKSLCRCILVSKRFATLVPQVDSVSVVAKPRLTNNWCSRTFIKSLFRNFPYTKPSIIDPAELSHWISNSVKNFPEIRQLRVQLPDIGGIVGFPENGGIVGFPETGGMLKWNAEFGKELELCAVILATTFEKASVTDPAVGADPSQEAGLLTHVELESNIPWILSCLRAAYARHDVVKQTVIDCLDLRSAVVTDARHQGRFSMNEKQITDLRDSFNSSSSETAPMWKRMPKAVGVIWYAPKLVLEKSGYVMKGVMLLWIWPPPGGREDNASKKDRGLPLKGGFGGGEEEEEVIREAVTKIILKSKRNWVYNMSIAPS